MSVKYPGPEPNFMSDKIFLDTNILVYAFDKENDARHRIASDLVMSGFKEGNTVISTQVLMEFFVTVTQKVVDKMTPKEAEQAVRDLALWPVVETSVSLVLRAIATHRKHRLSFWDAMIVAAAKTAGCFTVLTEDLSHHSRIENILILNPFTKGSQEDPA